MYRITSRRTFYIFGYHFGHARRRFPTTMVTWLLHRFSHFYTGYFTVNLYYQALIYISISLPWVDSDKIFKKRVEFLQAHGSKHSFPTFPWSKLIYALLTAASSPMPTTLSTKPSKITALLMRISRAAGSNDLTGQRPKESERFLS